MSTIKFRFGKLKYLIFILLIGFTCCEYEGGDFVTPIEDGSWITYSPYKWSHDGHPVEGLFCKIYSDGVSREIRPEIAGFADTKFLEVLQTFNYNNLDDFLFPPGSDKIDIYLNLNNEPAIAAAFWGSVFITVQSTEPDTSRLEYLSKHELTHEFEYLIEGIVNLGTDVWFREGIAINVGSDGGWDYVNNIERLESWISGNAQSENQGNPIRIHEWEDFPDGADITAYYTVFDLVMRYILDGEGLGKSKQDVLNLFFEVRVGNSFEDAFQNNFELSLQEFENSIFDRLRQYLAEK